MIILFPVSLFQGKALNEVITLANQKIAAKESKAIQAQGGMIL